MDPDGFRAELSKDSDLAECAKDARQVQHAWANTAAHDANADLAETDELPEDINGFPMTQDGGVRAFAAANADRLRFCHSSDRWHVWTGTHWRKEETKLAFNWARGICRARAAADLRSSAAKALAKAATAAAVERFAQADRAFAVTATAAAPVPLDAFDPVRDCPRWSAFLDHAAGSGVDAIRFIQQWQATA